MGFLLGQEVVVRYRGFLLLEQTNKGWLVRPERSPMRLLPFRTPSCSLADVKALLDWRLSKDSTEIKAASNQAAAGGGVGVPIGCRGITRVAQ